MTELCLIILPCIAWRKNNTQIANKYRIEWNGELGFDITHGEYGHTIDLSNEKCSYRSWKIKDILYPHAICCMFHKKLNLEDYISNYYNKEYYLKSYGCSMQPVWGMWLWKKSENPYIVPPAITKKFGRPKKYKRDKDELREKTRKLSKKELYMICGLCKTKDYNKHSFPLRQTSNHIGSNVTFTRLVGYLKILNISTS